MTLAVLERVVDAAGDVGRLLLDRRDDAAGVPVDPEVGVRVADLGDRVADDRGDVDVLRGRDLPRDDHEPGGDERLAGDPAVRVDRQDRVQDGVGDLVGELVGVPLGDRFRGEQVAVAHVGASIAVRPDGLFRIPGAGRVSGRAAWPGGRRSRRRARAWSTRAAARPRPSRDRIAARFVVGAEARPLAAHLVGDEEVQVLCARASRGPAASRSRGLGREPDQHAVALVARRARPGCRASGRGGSRGGPLVLLDLRVGRRRRGGSRRRRPPSRRRRPPQRPRARPLAHLLGRRHADDRGARRRLDRPGADDERHVRAAAERLRGDGEPHPPGRAVPDEPDRVDRLPRRPRRDDDPPPGEVPAPREHLLDRREDLLGLGSCGPVPSSPAASDPVAGPTIRTPRSTQRGDVGLGRRMLPHARVHRRREHERARPPRAASSVSRSSAMPSASFAMTLAVAGATTTTSASCASRTCRTCAGLLPQVGVDAVVREGGERGRTDEALRRSGHHDRHGRAARVGAARTRMQAL